MFTVDRSASISRFLRSKRGGTPHWPYIEQEWCWPWFYLETCAWDGADLFRRTLLVSQIEDLVELLAEQGDQFWLEQVLLVSPDHLNHQGRWAMELLSELCLSRDDQTGELGYVFKVEGGRSYSAHPGFGKGLLVDIEILFSRSTHLPPR